MDRKSLILAVVVLVILAGGAGYYFWSQKGILSIPGISNKEVTSQEGSSFLDDFFEKFKPTGEQKSQSGFSEYKDPNGVFSLQYPSSWVARDEKGILLSGVSFTPPELLNQYPEEEKQFVKGLIAAGTESKDSPSTYYENLVGEGNTGQTEAKALAVNGYPAYMVKGTIKGISYTLYIVSDNEHIVYFNYRTKEDESAHQNDIRKSIDFAPYAADFEAAINSIKFLK